MSGPWLLAVALLVAPHGVAKTALRPTAGSCTAVHVSVDTAGADLPVFDFDTRGYGEVIRASGAVASKGLDLTPLEKLVLTAVAYFQPVTRAGLADILCRHVSRDVIAAVSYTHLTLPTICSV